MAKKKKKPIIVEQVEVTGMADKGKGVGRDADGRVLFIENVAPGDVVDVQVTVKKAEFMEGYPVHYHSLSAERVEPFCQHFDLCGGCRWMHLDYPAQLFHKELVVKNALQRIGKVKVKRFLPILPCDQISFYRNKLEYAFSNKRWLTKEEVAAGVSNLDNVLGYHRAAAFDKILDIKYCWLQADPSNYVRDVCKQIALEHELEFYDLRTNVGIMRHVMIRLTSLGELMLIVSFSQEKPNKIKRYLDELVARCPQITSLFYCVNLKLNDYVGDLEMNLHAGKPFIEEQLGHVRFKIGPKSFFQTNSRQAKNLYDQVVEFAGLSGQENVYDLYTGVGSIALYVAKFCRHVVGIEEVPDAIVDAEENARRNDITNCTFYAGDVKNILTADFAERHGKPDLLITDPPRAGMHENVSRMLLELESPKIVYVSCNPATQARDLQLLSEKYDLEKIRPVDMFPHTHHVETVALLQLR